MELAELGSKASIFPIKDCVFGKPIGSGASMEVFEGTCVISGTKTKVALKRPRTAVSEGMRKKDISLTSVIKQELTIMERFKSTSNIVSLYGMTFDEFTPVLVVELATCSLDRYLSDACQRGLPITWIEKARLCCDIAEGLQALHKADIVYVFIIYLFPISEVTLAQKFLYRNCTRVLRLHFALNLTYI